MDIYSATIDALLSLPVAQDWPKMQDLIRKMADAQSRPWRLPAIACRAVGGSQDNVLPAVAAFACMQTSILLVDDLLDEDPRGVHHLFGAPLAANLAVAFQAAGLEILGQSDVQEQVRLAAMRSLNRMMLATAFGQEWDASNPSSEADYWQVVHWKSSPFFGAALQIGALMGGASAAMAERFNQLGRLYGELIQIHDDLMDTMETPANPDWIQGRSPLPVLFAEVVNHPDRERFLGLRSDITKPENLADAQAILLRCGAVSYCVEQIVHQYDRAKEMLYSLSLQDPSEIEAMLDGTVRPVHELFRSLGLEVDQPAFTPCAPRSMFETSGASSSC